MLGSSGSPHSYIGSLMIHPYPGDQPKVDLGHLCCRQPYAVEIIQLIEVPAPSRHFASSPIDPSSVASSSSSCYSSESESEYPFDDEETESVGPSYCSSDTPEQMDSEEEENLNPEDTHDARVTRVHAWRAKFAKDMGLTLSDTPPMNPTKRKAPDEHEIDKETASQTSKRSRSHRFTTHICPACDTCFPTRQNLRQHGQAQANEACRIAVEYDFE